MFYFYTPWKHQTTSGLLMSSGGIKMENSLEMAELFHDGGPHPYHVETSPLIFRANLWTGFDMIGTSVMKKLNNLEVLLS